MFLSYIQDFLKSLDLDTSLLEVPQDRTMGDFAYPCFSLAKEYKKSPVMIAADIETSSQELLGDHIYIARVVATGPYINIFLNIDLLATDVLQKVTQGGASYGYGSVCKEKIMIESPSPNTNKPLHLGHVRNMLLGKSLVNIYKASGRDVIATEIVNDRGTHICKSMLMYDRNGNNESPDIKSDHYVGKRYIEFAQEEKRNPSLIDDAQSLLQKRESGDEYVVALREKMREWCIKGFDETYAHYGVHIDVRYFESDIYKNGKETILAGLETGVFEKHESGAIYVDMNHKGRGEKFLQRSDGTAIYITQDMFLGWLRYQEHQMDRMVYVVGNEQEYHFQVLFEIYRLLGYSFADQCHHLNYGMIELPDGKMKSREGNVVDADTLLEDMIDQSKQLILERHPDIQSEELTTRSNQIALGAIKFFILKYDAKKNFVFDKNESLRFDGESGPYVQYTAVRCASILTKSPYTDMAYDPTLLGTDLERQLLLHISDFATTIYDAAHKYQPYLIARYILELSQLFNTYYQKTKILDENEAMSRSRLALVRAVRQVLENGLALLGIEIPERM